MAKRSPSSRSTEAEPIAARVRLDKWLWAARFYRTRTLASAAVEAGAVRVAGVRVKPARALNVGETVTLRKHAVEWNVIVTALDERRGSAAAAARLYEEPEASRQQREQALALLRAAQQGTPQLPGRPTKRDRRRLEDFLNEP